MSGSAFGWNPIVCEQAILNLDREKRHKWCVFALRFMQFSHLVPGACLAIASVKHDSRPFAWGIQSFKAVVKKAMQQVYLQERIWFGDRGREPPTMSCPMPTEQAKIFCGIGQLIMEHSRQVDQPLGHVAEPNEHGCQLWRAFYMQLVITLQDGTPHAEHFEFDIARLAQELGMSQTELFELAEREACRPGCQFGVLIWAAREEAREAVATARAAQSAAAASSS